MGPGGPRSLQNCCEVASAFLGGFDSLALPPLFKELLFEFV
jgi:hypothetical protein